MSVDIILKDIEWDGVNKIRVPLEGGGTQDFSIGGGVTPTGNINITHSGQTDVTNYATATVPSADANAGSISSSYVTENNQRKWKFTYEGYAESPGWVDEGAFGSPQTYEYNAVPSNTTITPTTSAQTIGGQNYMMEGAVTVSAVPSMTLPTSTTTTTIGSEIAQIGANSIGERYLNIPEGYNDSDKYYTIKKIETVTAGTPIATKGTVSNHSVSVTPSVTNPRGYIASSTITGTAVTVSASELVSGSETKTRNGTYDVTNLAELVVDVPSGGSSNLETGTFTTSSSAGVGSVLVGYIGSGYPIACMVFVEGGSYVSGTDWYNSKQRYAVGFWSMSKSVQGTAPDYGTSGTQNQGVVTSVYKNSTSSATSYTRTSAMNNNVYTSNNASNSALNVIKLKANNVLSYYTNTSSYGLLPNTTYRYYIIYSS